MMPTDDRKVSDLMGKLIHSLTSPSLTQRVVTALSYRKRRLLTLLKEITLRDLLPNFSDSVVLEIHIQFLEVFLQPHFWTNSWTSTNYVQFLICPTQASDAD